MAFDKFDPHKPERPVDPESREAQAMRRARLLKWGWIITTAYTALGFGFIFYWYLTGQAG